ncbi:5721_t:CDS:2 [Paraglomus occultum]|uniref:5721_t:CDS:1 n=1 Tax=Paraglomus occultum TaxID=144539 RepID=A0A9N8VSW6_9GLOM|nr:5721_t:CDS:2 [Paraglomus occultum]
MTQTTVITRCHARVGLMGNPSDGFFGKTISFLISNFYVELTLLPNSFTHSLGYQSINFLSSPTSNAYSFENRKSLIASSVADGYNNDHCLLQATCKVFFTTCETQDIFLHEQGFSVFFETNIPRQVGLAGSSAIITAFWKALMKFYNIDDNKIPLSERPSLILSVERDELGVTAGYMDRVIQSYGGLVFMDFDREQLESRNAGFYERIPLEKLPKGFWLAYEGNPSDSGKIHSDVRKRWEAGDEKVIKSMKRFATFAEKAREALLDSSHDQSTKRKIIASLMNQNFDLRRELFGDATLGSANLRMIELSRKHGFAAKFTGSGGAILGLWSGDNDEKSVEHVEKLRLDLQKEGFMFCWVQPELGITEGIVKRKRLVFDD